MKIFTFRMVSGQELRAHAKFRRDRLNGCRDIAIFRFPMWRPSAILDFFTHARDHQRSGIVGLYHCAKFGLNRLSSFDNIEV